MRRELALFSLILLGSCGGGDPGTTPSNGNVATVSLSPATGTLVLQQNAQLVATLKDADGNALSGKSITWSAAPTGIVSVSSSGLVTGVAVGAATVSATAEGKSASATFSVKDGAMIGSSGGTVNAAGGKVQIVLPTNAVTGNTPISVTPVTSAQVPQPSLMLANTAYELGPSGTFGDRVKVTVSYSAIPGGGESNLGIYYYNGSKWVPTNNWDVDSVNHRVTGETMHFTPFGICKFPCYPDEPRVSIHFDQPRVKDLLVGSSVSFTGYLSTNNFPAVPTCIASGLPAGVTATIGIVGAYVTVTYTASVTATAGYYWTHFDCASGTPGGGDDLALRIKEPGFSYTIASANVSVVQGLSATDNITITHVGTPKAVSFSATGLPTGITASFNPASTTGTSSVMTVTALANAPVGSFTGAVLKGSSVGEEDQNLPFQVTVISSSGFSLRGTPPFASLTPGGSGFTSVVATRASGFTSTIAYSVSGLPTGLTAVVSNTAVADSVKITFTATAGVTPGQYNATVTGSANGKSENVTIVVTVGSAGSATVSLDLGGCVAAGRSVWVAAQDGNNPWVRLTGISNVFAYQVTGGKGGVAVAITGGSYNELYVNYGTPAELMARNLCDEVISLPRVKTLNFSATGLAPNDRVDVSLSGEHVTLQSGLPSFTFTHLLDGPWDLMAWKYNLTTPGQNIRGIIRRNQNIASGGTAPPFDFNGSESFAAVSSTATWASGGEPTFAYMGYYSQGLCSNYADLGNQMTITNTIWGVPPAAQQPNDLHEFGLSTQTRQAYHQFHTLAPQNLALGALAPTPTVTTLPGGQYRRLQVAMTLPSDYSYASYVYGDGSTRYVMLSGNTGYFNGQSMQLTAPDFSGLSGFDPNWVPPIGSTGGGFTEVRSGPPGGCFEGNTVKIAQSGGN